MRETRELGVDAPGALHSFSPRSHQAPAPPTRTHAHVARTSRARPRRLPPAVASHSFFSPPSLRPASKKKQWCVPASFAGARDPHAPHATRATAPRPSERELGAGAASEGARQRAARRKSLESRGCVVSHSPAAVLPAPATPPRAQRDACSRTHTPRTKTLFVVHQPPKRGLSLEEKRREVLAIFHETADVFQLKVGGRGRGPRERERTCSVCLSIHPAPFSNQNPPPPPPLLSP